MRNSMDRETGSWGISPGLGVLPLLLVLAVGSRAWGAYTEPRLALTRATVHHSASAVASVQLEGTFSFADLIQLAAPVNVYVMQGTLTARLDQAGNVYTSTAGGPEQPASGPGLVSLKEREILIVLPTGFHSGTATIRVEIIYDGGPISTNELGVTL